MIEWSERLQEFFTNEITDGKANHPPEKNGLESVYIARNNKDAYMIGKFIESIIKVKGSIGYGQELKARQIQLLIKKVVDFADRRMKAK